MKDVIIGDKTESGLSTRQELELKITKIGALAATLSERIRVHEGRLAKLYRTQEQADASYKIRKLTQRILENS
mgnify:CR=1 FL=1